MGLSREREFALHRTSAFTLVEVLVVIAMIAVLAALLLPALSRAKSLAKRIACVNNVHQITLALHGYADDHADKVTYFTNTIYYAYKDCLLPYLGSPEASSSNSPVFVCPADTGLYRAALTHYASYGFNGVDRGSNNLGMANQSFATVHQPSRTSLDGEISGGLGVSWHSPRPGGQYCNAPNVGGFVDGHVSYVRIYWSGAPGIAGFPFYYEPPAGYEYKWSPN
jgi:prepilin-type N-terminal cleavage/methylation domain-containing protein